VKYPAHIWAQLKNLSCDELIKALERDGWIQDTSCGAVLVYLHEENNKRITVHYHPAKTYGPNLLKGLLEDIGWTVDDMRRLKLVKKK
jgi:predicted RNA binding protein YcfA (HicA-like mRNA interferase family)